MSWWYESGGERCGPVPEEELLRLFEDGRIGNETLIWQSGMSDWMPFAQVWPVRARRAMGILGLEEASKRWEGVPREARPELGRALKQAGRALFSPGGTAIIVLSLGVPLVLLLIYGLGWMGLLLALASCSFPASLWFSVALSQLRAGTPEGVDEKLFRRNWRKGFVALFFHSLFVSGLCLASGIITFGLSQFTDLTGGSHGSMADGPLDHLLRYGIHYLVFCLPLFIALWAFGFSLPLILERDVGFSAALLGSLEACRQYGGVLSKFLGVALGAMAVLVLVAFPALQWAHSFSPGPGEANPVMPLVALPAGFALIGLLNFLGLAYLALYAQIFPPRQERGTLSDPFAPSSPRR